VFVWSVVFIAILYCLVLTGCCEWCALWNDQCNARTCLMMRWGSGRTLIFKAQSLGLSLQHVTSLFSAAARSNCVIAILCMPYYSSLPRQACCPLHTASSANLI
jgi:hypothetical protein